MKKMAQSHHWFCRYVPPNWQFILQGPVPERPISANPSLKKEKHFIWVSMYFKKELIGDTVFTYPTGDGTAILCGHPSYAKV